MKSISKGRLFELIAFSSPASLAQEFSHVNQMFGDGLECFHLRKPGLNKSEYLAALQQIKPEYLKRIMLHGHYELALKYNIRGLHISASYFQNSGNELLAVLKTAKKRGLKISTGIHEAEELDGLPKGIDYVFWSPVFDSISKPGYKANIDLTAAVALLKSERKSKIIALGGIDCNNINSIVQSGFDGAAVLGALWQVEYPYQKFKQFRNQIQK